MSDEIPKPKPAPVVKTPMHGGLKFILLTMPGFLAGCGLIVGELAIASDAKSNVLTSILSFSGVALFFGAILVGTVKKQWGWSGLLLGMSIPVAMAAMLASLCGGK